MGKNVVVTGSGQGIGLQISNLLAEIGYSVILADVNEQNIEQNVEKLISKGLKASGYKVDLSEIDSINEFVSMICSDYDIISGLVNNARPWVSYEKFPLCLKSWDIAMNVMAKAPAILSSLFMEKLAIEGGSIINISSTNARFVSQQPMTYHAAKAALEQVTRFLSVELGSKNIRVNSIAPGLIDQFDKETKLSDDPVNRAIIEASVPLRMAGSGLDVGNLVEFLLTDKSRYITGQCFVIDGGITNLDHFYSANKIIRSLGN